jgi:hypothetical protein
MSQITIVKVAAILLVSSTLLFSQNVSFSSPNPWVTMREKGVIATSQVDTSKLKGKKIKIVLSQCGNGKENALATRNFSISDYSQKFDCGSAPELFVGGKDFLRIKWEVPGSDMKGTIEPIGIAVLNNDSSIIYDEALKISGELTAAAVKNKYGDAGLRTVGKFQAAISWNDQTLAFVCSKTGSGALLLSIDGKNGKNAFLSFPDRFIGYQGKNDSLLADYYQRTIDKSAIQYVPQRWVNSIIKIIKDDLVLITIPWSDLGILPFDGRIIGYSLFNIEEDGKQSQAHPVKAIREIPGTWGNLKLVVGK